jgi:ankyrin repeat protein
MDCRVGRIRRLLERGADPNAKNEMEMTPLHEAAKSCPEAIPLLIGHGADPAREAG